MSAALLAAIKALAGPRLAVAVEPVDSDNGLFPDEAKAVAQAISKRRAEFAAGRRAARRALAALGEPEVCIPAAPDRRPLWPKGLTGSISHDAGLAIAAVALTRDFRGIGMDLTVARPLPPGVDREILTDDERHLGGLEACMVFSAKETLFKALYPDVGVFFGFDAAEIRPDLARGKFAAKLRRNLGPWPAGQCFHGGAALCGAHLVTFLRITV